MNKRCRFGLAIFFVALVLSLAPSLASAGKGWCRSDPIVVVDGTQHRVEIAVNFPLDGSGHAISATVFGFYYALDASLISTDSGLDGMGEVVKFFTDSRSSNSYVWAKTNGAYPLEIYVDGVLVKTGFTGSPVYYAIS
jgi:hypothetical protein